MADMSDVLEVLTSIENYLVDLPTKIILRANQIFIVNGLSDVSENLGIVTAGEFRAGNRNEPGMFLRTAVAGSGFSGMRMRYPAMSYDLDGVMTDWNLVGINDDILQFGVRASDGKLVAGGGAVILDEDGITAVGGTIAGWTIDTTELTNTKIKISSAGSIESVPFVSGILGTGWKISENGDAEFNNAVIRGELRTTVLTYQEVQAVSGTLGVFKSSGVILETTGAVPAVASSMNIKIKDPEYGHTQLFTANDVIWIKDGTNATWLTVTGATDNTTYYTYACTVESGSTGNVYTAGQAVVNFGQSGAGFLLMEATGTGSPYFSVRARGASPWSTNTEHVRMGNLNGNWGYATDVYGVAMGVYDTNLPNITIDSTNGLRMRTNTDTIIQLDTSGDALLVGDLKINAGTLYFGLVGSSYLSWLDDDGINLTANDYTGGIEPTFAEGSQILWRNPDSSYSTDHPYPITIIGTVYDEGTEQDASINIAVDSAGASSTATFAVNVYSSVPGSTPTVYKQGRFNVGKNWGEIFFNESYGLGDSYNHGIRINGNKSIDIYASRTNIYGLTSWSLFNEGLNHITISYNTSTSFVVDKGNWTDLFFIGTKVKFTQTTVKYFYVTGSSYDSGTNKTRIDVTGDTVANAVISDLCYSHALVANGAPDTGGVWKNWTPTLTGWSSNPTDGVYRYCVVGKLCTLAIYQPNNGTSNSTSTNLTIPFTSAASGIWSAPIRFLDNGTPQAAPGLAWITKSDNIIAFYKTYGAGAWTASGDKRIISCVLTYEIA